MAEPISACQVLCEAGDLIEEKGWIQHSPKTAKGYCLSGACNEVLNRKTGLSNVERDLLSTMVAMHLTAAIKPGSTATSFLEAQSYNDAKGRKKEEILDVVRRAGTCPSR